MEAKIIKSPMTIQKWYGTSLKVPNFDNWRFTEFVVSSIGIVSSIVENSLGKEIGIRFMHGKTACADYDSNTIFINQVYLQGKFFADAPAFGSDETLSALLGIIVHEAAHFAYTPKDLEPMVKCVETRSTLPFNKQIAHTIANILEDIYIEAESDRQAPALTWMLDATNDIFFTSMSEMETVQQALSITKAPQDICEVSSALNLLIFAKTRPAIEATPFMQELFAKARSATDAVYESERCLLTLEIYNTLMREITQEMLESMESVALSGDSEGGLAGQAMAETQRRAEGFGSVPGVKQNVNRSIAGTTGEMEGLLKELMGKKLTLLPAEDNAEVSSLVVESVPISGPPVRADMRYAALAEAARQQAVVNRPYGLDKSRGHSIRKLYRIATDSKIFAETVSMNSYKPMEVVILIDCSASMRSMDTAKGSRIELAMQAALGAAVALSEAHCDVAVYGHTGDTIGQNIDILHCKGFHEPVSILAGRLGGVLHKGELAENRDGSAISFIRGKFSGKKRRKVLLVISDGQPLADNYHGPKANEHTERMVQKTRERGIDVLSISITAEAAKVNNQIYGFNHNVINDDPNVIADIVRKLILR